ncbi:glycerol-3-phosphate dehydrogenase/oxidase [Janibacter sp. Soil728]|uniref:glycerol-3-phosphate dehydrogenase/oxidase n=1 Tax=Janibacter sp. Soil728 TaxID=1736393 RepID=UPI000B0FA263|nr:glycerol-3-phosphate dehydrogenase/oxidase [Janibacter sp. Soil728]
MSISAPSASLNRTQRQAALERLATEEYDVIVVGGGVTGAGAALDAASRGLRTALVERHDLASGTSRWSSKLIHGGLRYLAKADFPIAYRSAVERHHLITRIAPHLVRPLRNIVPDTSVIESVAGNTGIFMADGLRRAAGTPSSILPTPRRVSARAVHELVPGARQGVRGIMYSDGQVEDDARLVATLARTAAAYGADIVTYCEADPLSGDRVRLTDTLTGQSLEARGNVLLATGVWGGEHEPKITVTPSRGSHLVLRAERLGFPKAQLSAPVPGHFGRFIFTIPISGDLVLLGLTDEPAPGVDGTAPSVPLEDETFLLETMSGVLAQPLTSADVVGRFAGLRPLVTMAGKGEGGSSADASRDHLLIDEPGAPITITGGKLTEYRRMAEDAIDAIARRVDGDVAACRTTTLPLLGAAPAKILRKVDAPPRLVRRYGTFAPQVMALADQDPTLAEPVAPGCATLGVELAYAVAHEGALTVEDLLERRTRTSFVEADVAAATPAAERALALVAP